MGADMKRLDSLSKQIDQYESHLAMVKSDISALSSKRDQAKADLEDMQAKSKAVVEQAHKECEDLKLVMKAAQADIDAKNEKILQDRKQLNQDRSGLLAEMDKLEMRRRDFENDKRRIAGFIQIIDQAVKAWK